MAKSRLGVNDDRVRQLYEQAVATHGPALKRLARAYEPDAERRKDVLQELHLALWQSLAVFDGRVRARHLGLSCRAQHRDLDLHPAPATGSTTTQYRGPGSRGTRAGTRAGGRRASCARSVARIDSPAAAVQLFPESENRFFAKVGGIEIWFDRDAQARSAALNIRQGGGTRQLKRVE